ncbi:MAG TPA: hypothetical protein DG754_14875 [Bacteroidales bacterium]|nr:hypothetical protein [Bacteroidales bacterium]
MFFFRRFIFSEIYGISSSESICFELLKVVVEIKISPALIFIAFEFNPTVFIAVGFISQLR